MRVDIAVHLLTVVQNCQIEHLRHFLLLVLELRLFKRVIEELLLAFELILHLVAGKVRLLGVEVDGAFLG